MEELIKVDTDKQTVSARELYRALEIKYDFKRWVESNFKNFIENTDYFAGHIDVRGNQYGGEQVIIDYDLTVDMAKHLCLMSQTEKGKQCRQYLIDLEKAWNTPEQVMARALRIADETIASLQKKTEFMAKEMIAMNDKIEEMQPKVSYLDKILESKDTVLVTQIAQDYGMSARGFNKMLHDLGVQHKIHNQWVLYSKYQGKGYVHSHTHVFEKSDGQTGNCLNTEWTQKGRLFLYDFLKVHNKLPLIEQEMR